MVSRQQLHDRLRLALGSNYVYYQPPENLKMNFPAIVYTLSDMSYAMANNKKYIKNRSYKVIVISHTVDPEVVSTLEDFDYCKFQQVYTADGLYHYVFRINT